MRGGFRNIAGNSASGIFRESEGKKDAAPEGSVLHHEVHEPSRDDDLLHHGFALDVARGHGAGLFEELFLSRLWQRLKFLRSLPLI